MHVVTGGAGFIGSNLARMLIERGRDDVVIVDDLGNGRKFANIVDLDIADYIDHEDFLQRMQERQFRSAIKAILHQGACSTTTEWDGRYMMQNNYRYSQELLHHCLSERIAFLYASSAAVYGASQSFAENPDNERPLNVYGYSKLQFDRYVRRVASSPQSQVAGLRYFNVYGPGEQHKGNMASVAWHFRNQLLEQGEVRLFEGCDGFGNGEQRRDFVYVDDICELNLWLLEHGEVSGVFNAGTGKAQTFNDVANAVVDWHGKGAVRYIEFPEHLRGAYQSFTEADLTQLRRTGCDVEFRDVAAGVRDYMANLAGSS